MDKKKKFLLFGALAVILVIGAFVAGRIYIFRVKPYEEQSTAYTNLLDAVQGETTARNKYILFAQRAKEVGDSNSEKLFTAAADAELIHIEKEYAVANKMKPYAAPEPNEVPLLSVKENLQSCIDGENYEANEMYPLFLKQANASNYPKAEQIFRYARDAEASHSVLFAERLESLNNGTGNDVEETYYMCPVCGKLEKGKASTFCSVCGTPGLMFKAY